MPKPIAGTSRPVLLYISGERFINLGGWFVNIQLYCLPERHVLQSTRRYRGLGERGRGGGGVESVDALISWLFLCLLEGGLHANREGTPGFSAVFPPVMLTPTREWS